MAGTSPLPRHLGVYGPESRTPPGVMLLLDDRVPNRHDPVQIVSMVRASGAESVLLDFEQEPDADSIRFVKDLSQALDCPLAAPPGFSEDPVRSVFLPPCPLHVPLAEYLQPWQGREVWLDIALQQQVITVTPDGTRYSSPVPSDRQDGGWFDEILCCRCTAQICDDLVRFILFDTPETLKRKLEQAAALGVTRALGLYQELNGKL